MHFVRSVLFVLLLSSLPGCAVNEKTYWAVTDSEAYWTRSGFSIKPPLGSTWSKLPVDDNHPNLIAFSKGSGVYIPGATDKWIYMNGTVVLATSTLLDEPVQDRKDTKLLLSALRTHLNRYQMYWATKITSSDYESFTGLDCLKYVGTPQWERRRSESGDYREKGIKGYFCLHPKNDSFGVMMESRDFASVNTISNGNTTQTDHFFSSLSFTPLSSSVSRTFKTATHQIGKSPHQLALFNGNMWVALQGEDRVVQLDPADGKIIASVSVGKQPVSLAGGEKSIWVANSGDGTVTRIDPVDARVVQTIQVGGKPVSITVGQGNVWVADSSRNTVIRINPVTNTVAATISVGKEPLSVAAGKDGIWTANAGDGTVSLIDKAHDWTSETINVGGRPVSISLTDAGAWVADERGKAVVRIDRTSKTVSSRIDVGGNPSWITAFNGWDLFVALSDSSKIVRIDPALNRVFGPPIQAEAAPLSMVYNAGSIWFANSTGTSLTAVNLDPTGQLISTPPVP